VQRIARGAHQLSVGLTVGLAWRDAHHDVDGDALLREADAAMHEEKSRLPPAA
jgi:GGDEF domain-containing protein